jgi:hypothetical protein
MVLLDKPITELTVHDLAVIYGVYIAIPMLIVIIIIVLLWICDLIFRKRVLRR